MNDKEEGKQRRADSVSAQGELSETWRELLGTGSENVSFLPVEGSIPTLASDPWSELIHEKGIEIVDLDKNHLRISDQEVEQMLELMQEQERRQGEAGESSAPK